MQNWKDVVCSCTDSLCKGILGFHGGHYPALYDMYARKLLQHGWAGNESPEETAFRQRMKPASDAMKERMKRMRAKQKPLAKTRV